MSLRPDSWIRRKAGEGMIEPFEERQVREGTISYGLSSYGYDIRIADEYKIFTNVNSTIVDPKAFDPRSFVDFTGPVCIVPPNSFALGRSVEYFRIPRSVMTVTVGKSTYARCFRGDTRVALVDGTSLDLETMTLRSEAGERFWGYALGEFGRILVASLHNPRWIGRDALLEVILDNGHTVCCTPDHEFISRDGRRRAAAALRPGDSLMPLYRHLARGYEVVYQPINGRFVPTHRMADEWNLRNGVYAELEASHRHHRDGNRRNNSPPNIERVPATEHVRMHNAKTFGAEFDGTRHGRLIRDAFAVLRNDPAWRAHQSRVQSERARRLWSDETYAVRGAAQLLGCDRSAFRRFPKILAAWRTRTARNHKVSGIRELRGEHDVYCLTVPEAGNFALAAGVFVRNCGILTNVTPLEPEWEGFVTLEISNTTPLPAKIYSNEGIAQVVFFESDEPCEVSYADRGGKYQGQRGITLPRL